MEFLNFNIFMSHFSKQFHWVFTFISILNGESVSVTRSLRLFSRLNRYLELEMIEKSIVFFKGYKS